MADASSDDRLIIAANRGPVVHRRGDNGSIVAVRGGGGLVTALLGIAATRQLTWIASAMTPEDAQVAAAADDGEIDLEHDGHHLGLRYVIAEPDAYDKFYNVIANPLLWFIQHYLWDLPESPSLDAADMDAWENGYQRVNRLFADAVCEKLRDQPGVRPLVMLHDYHLYTCPAMIRESYPHAFLHQFVHIPWPQSDSWRVLPGPIREQVFRGILSNDIIGLHTPKYVRNFLEGCSELMGLETDSEAGTVIVDDRTVNVRSYPVSIDCGDFERLAASEAVLAEGKKIEEARPRHLVLRVDRMDLSKNIVRGFEAYGLFLEQHPEFRKNVVFLALMQPSREDIPQYAEYRQRISEVVARVNEAYGSDGWLPIDLRIQDNFPASVAAYKQYDMLVVNAVFDGMNLIAKEAGYVNERNGVLVLSENTGAHEELAGAAISVNPFDLDGQARAFHQALTMPDDEKKRLAGMLKETVRENDIHNWITEQFQDIKAIRGGDR